MRVLVTTGVLLLPLTVVLIGCGKSGTQGGKAGNPAPNAASQSASTAVSSGSECVVGVDGMS
jgi:hypothetical protein